MVFRERGKDCVAWHQFHAGTIVLRWIRSSLVFSELARVLEDANTQRSAHTLPVPSDRHAVQFARLLPSIQVSHWLANESSGEVCYLVKV